MGWDIVSGKSKKLIDDDYNNVLSHISCQYAYNDYFERAFGKRIDKFKGRLTIKKKQEFVNGIDNFIDIPNNEIDVPIFQGYISNCGVDKLKQEFMKLKELILEGKIGYMRMS